MAILGIHTDVPNQTDPHGSHAWITLEKDGVTRDFALYKQEYVESSHHGQGQEKGWDGSGTHVREGIDSKTGRMATENLYQEITPEQESAFFKHLELPQKYGKGHNNCAHWASDSWEKTTGQKLDITTQRDCSIITGRVQTFESPIGLESSIVAKNREIEALSATRANPAAQTVAEDERIKAFQQQLDKAFSNTKTSPDLGR